MAVWAVPPGVVTTILWLVAPLGTYTLILVAVSFLSVPGTPPKLTLAFSRLVPLMVTTVPTGPEVGLKLVIVGAPWGAAGVTALDGADAAPVPLALVAVTVKV